MNVNYGKMQINHFLFQKKYVPKNKTRKVKKNYK